MMHQERQISTPVPVPIRMDGGGVPPSIFAGIAGRRAVSFIQNSAAGDLHQKSRHLRPTTFR
jgi:hypothetical protein